MPIGDCYCPCGYLVQRLPYTHTGGSRCFMCDIKDTMPRYCKGGRWKLNAHGLLVHCKGRTAFKCFRKENADTVLTRVAYPMTGDELDGYCAWIKRREKEILEYEANRKRRKHEKQSADAVPGGEAQGEDQAPHQGRLAEAGAGEGRKVRGRGGRSARRPVLVPDVPDVEKQPAGEDRPPARKRAEKAV